MTGVRHSIAQTGYCYWLKRFQDSGFAFQFQNYFIKKRDPIRKTRTAKIEILGKNKNTLREYEEIEEETDFDKIL